MENTSTNFDTALEALSNLSNNFTVSVPIFSTPQVLEFKEINAKQQKELIQSITDTSLYKVAFTKLFYTILKENLLIQSFNIDQLTIFDKIIVGLYLRSKISSKLNVIFQDNPIITEVIDLQKIINNISNYNHPTEFILKEIKNNIDLEIKISVPIIKLELEYEEELYKNYKKADDIKNVNEIGSIVSDAFIGEISKYISYIRFGNTEINLDTLTPKQRIKVTEKLTADIIQKVLEKVSEWRQNLDKFLTVKHSENKLAKVLTIDNLLFLM
jgi:hypothetical protein